MMDRTYITPNGVSVSTTKHEVYLFYSLSSSFNIEVCFSSVQEIVNKLEISSLDALSPADLCDYYFQDVNPLNAKKYHLYIS
jgi:hypothetical protein